MTPNAQAAAIPDIFKYFWFFGAAIMALNVGVWRRRLLVAVERGRASRAEVDAFILRVGAWLVGGPIALAVTELGAGWSSPFCAVTAPADSVPMVTLAIVSLAGGAILLQWVWRGNGSDFLARVAPAFQRNPNFDKVYPASYVRTYVTFVIIALALSPLTWRLKAPSPEATGCPVAHIAGP